MIFVLLCRDKPGHLDLRLANREAHLEHLKKIEAEGRLHFAGPFLGTDGRPEGSMVAIEAADEAEARALCETDPYARAGLFQTVEIRPWTWVLGRPGART